MEYIFGGIKYNHCLVNQLENRSVLKKKVILLIFLFSTLPLGFYGIFNWSAPGELAECFVFYDV